jgi:Periplasmic copper-binding protein (NosD)
VDLCDPGGMGVAGGIEGSHTNAAPQGLMVEESPQSTRIRYSAAILSVGLLLALGMIMAPAASAAPAPVSSCQTLDSPGAYALTADLAAVDATCIEITASDTSLDLSGHTISCTGSGFEGSCQVPAFTDHGISVGADLSGVFLKGPGTIDGFDNGVVIVGGEAHVKDITVTGPDCDPTGCSRPISNGILVAGQLIETPEGTFADVGPAAVILSGNHVSGHARGIGLLGAECPAGVTDCVVQNNVAQENTGGLVCDGIGLSGTTGYTVTRNTAHSNGSTSCFPPRGIGLDSESTGNTVTRNDSSNNNGFGISIGPFTNGNTIVNNIARGNARVDLNAFPGTTNLWSDNNRCNTEGGAVPPSVCNPGE